MNRIATFIDKAACDLKTELIMQRKAGHIVLSDLCCNGLISQILCVLQKY